MSDYTVETITVDEHPEYRARIVTDQYPDEPYDDGQSPILALYPDGKAEHKWLGSFEYSKAAEVERAADHFHGEPDKFERYLKIFHGVTAVKVRTEYSYRGAPDYLTYDPTEWREYVGAPENSVDMTEWSAYLDGEVYGIIVEKAVTWVKSDDPDETRDDWEETDLSVWGFYGDVDGYVTEEAKRLIEEAAE